VTERTLLGRVGRSAALAGTVPDVRRFLLVRHGESEWNAIGRWQGQADPPLSARGREQAWLAAQRIGAVDAIVASSLRRAFDTARIISEAIGVGPVVLEPDLMERHAGEWEGLTRAEIEAQWPGYLDAKRRPPGYELDEPLLERVHAGLARIRAEVPGDDLLVLTHGGVINALEASFGLDWQRVPNLGARWFVWDGAHYRIGDRLHLVDEEHETVQPRGQL
jgi:broad specificity phosphatase PhoE